jgi:hypothetical protein
MEWQDSTAVSTKCRPCCVIPTLQVTETMSHLCSFVFSPVISCRDVLRARPHQAHQRDRDVGGRVAARFVVSPERHATQHGGDRDGALPDGCHRVSEATTTAQSGPQVRHVPSGVARPVLRTQDGVRAF